MDQRVSVLAAGVLALGLVAAGFLISGSLGQLRSGAQIVSVKGLAEKEVTADYVNWAPTFTTSGQELPAVQAQMREAQDKIEAFLVKAGLAVNDDFRVTPWRVTDSRARDYGGNPSADRYIMEATVQISTAKVGEVTAAARDVSSLLAQGVLVGSASGVSYIFTDINRVKPALIGEATRQARLAAEQFASDSAAKVGSISRASQGAINIRVRGQDYDDASDPRKIVRVVTTIDYLLEK